MYSPSELPKDVYPIKITQVGNDIIGFTQGIAQYNLRLHNEVVFTIVENIDLIKDYTVAVTYPKGKRPSCLPPKN